MDTSEIAGKLPSWLSKAIIGGLISVGTFVGTHFYDAASANQKQNDRLDHLETQIATLEQIARQNNESRIQLTSMAEQGVSFRAETKRSLEDIRTELNDCKGMAKHEQRR